MLLGWCLLLVGDLVYWLQLLFHLTSIDSRNLIFLAQLISASSSQCSICTAALDKLTMADPERKVPRRPDHPPPQWMIDRERAGLPEPMIMPTFQSHPELGPHTEHPDRERWVQRSCVGGSERIGILIWGPNIL